MLYITILSVGLFVHFYEQENIILDLEMFEFSPCLSGFLNFEEKVTAPT